MSFGLYARYYDLLYRDKDYAAEAAYVARRLRQHASGATRILELGCGTGGHAEQLAGLGFAVHGIDRSEGMIARANARKSALAPDLEARLAFTQGDVQSIRTGDRYDAIVSLFHVMSYQTTNAELQAMFATAASHLNPGGLFLFDFWYGPAVLAQRPETRELRIEDEAIRVIRIAEPVLHEERSVVDVNYTIRIEDKSSGKSQEIQETHPMRYLFLTELELLRGSSFRELASCAWLGDGLPGARDWAAFQVLVRA